MNANKAPVAAAAAGPNQQHETTKKTPKRRYRRTRSAPAPAGSKITKASSPFNPKSIINNLHPSFIRVAIFLAVYLFVSTLCFSVAHHHINGKKSNAVLDAIYLSVVTMTTVRYGDLVPENVATKLIVCVYVFLGMALVGLMLTKAADYLVEKQENLLVNAISRNHKTGTVLDVTHESEMKRVKYKCLTVVVILVFLSFFGILVLLRVEKLSFADAFYCLCCTISTLGYGDVSFSTRGGRTFAIFWIPAGTLCVALFYMYVAELGTEMKRNSVVKWVLTRKMTRLDLEAADLDGDGTVDATEFVIFKLKEMGKIESRDIKLCIQEFERLDVDQTGTLSASDITLARPLPPNRK